jgi:hypothetical protein
MLRFLLLLGLLSSSLNILSQTDTLNNYFNPIGGALIPSPNGGFVSGSNGYADSEKLQSFFPVGTYSILGVLSWNGQAVHQSSNEDSKVCFMIKNLDTSAVSTFPYFKGPTYTIDSTYISISELITNSNYPEGLQYVPFSEPVLITGPYLVGFNIDSLAKDSEGELIDSFSVYSSAIDSQFVSGYSWEKWNGLYKRIVDSWGFEIDLGIFPVIDTNLNSISQNLKLQKLTVYPNPANDQITIVCDKNNTYYKAELYDLRGKLVMQTNLSTYSNNHTILLSNIAPGLYTIRLSGNQTLGISPLIIR